MYYSRMDQEIISELKHKLIDEKNLIEKDLSSFARKDLKAKGGWDTIYPEMGDAQTGAHLSLEEAADEVEEYENLTAREQSLESRLAEINRAFERMKNGRYGLCIKCQKEIPIERLRANPAAEFDIEHAS